MDADNSLNAKFHKYLDRTRLIFEGTHPKHKDPQQSLGAIAKVLHSHPFDLLISHLDLFDFEDRKHVQAIVLELLNSDATAHVATQQLQPSVGRLIGELLPKYKKHDIAPFVGTYFRLFATSEKLVSGWQDEGHLAALSQLILDTDFNVQSDALETLQELLIAERPSSSTFTAWLGQHAEAVLQMF